MSAGHGGSRDQAASRISAILMRLCDSAGAHGVALVDPEGETVDYAGRLPPFDTRVAAAEWRLVLGLLEACRSPALRGTHELSIRARRQSFCVFALSDGYALVLVLPRYGGSVSRRALAEAGHELEVETGLAPRFARDREKWVRVEVRASKNRRPEAIWYEGGWRPLTIVGRFDSGERQPRERGYLTRLPTGVELLLVREALGRWFAGRTR